MKDNKFYYDVNKWGMNAKYGQHYGDGKRKIRSYRKPYRRGMNKNEFRILWSALWFLFIFGLSVVFNTMGPLWLLIFWFVGIVE